MKQSQGEHKKDDAREKCGGVSQRDTFLLLSLKEKGESNNCKSNQSVIKEKVKRLIFTGFKLFRKVEGKAACLGWGKSFNYRLADNQVDSNWKCANDNIYIIMYICVYTYYYVYMYIYT